jgi:hypothetical protein
MQAKHARKSSIMEVQLKTGAGFAALGGLAVETIVGIVSHDPNNIVYGAVGFTVLGGLGSVVDRPFNAICDYFHWLQPNRTAVPSEVESVEAQTEVLA